MHPQPSGPKKRVFFRKNAKADPQTAALPEKSLGRFAWFLPFVSGVLLLGAFPRFEQGWLAWLALVPLLRFGLHVSPRQALAGGFLFGLPLHLYLNFYLVKLFFDYLTPGPALVIATGLIFVLCLFYALFTFAVSLARQAHPLILAWLVPSLWLAMEYLRSLGFLGYTAGFLGYTQWRYPAVLNLAACYGYWGLPFLMVTVQTLAVLLWQKKLYGKTAGVACGVWGLLICTGLLLPEAWAAATTGSPLQVALIQGNTTAEEILECPAKELALQRYLHLTREAVQSSPGVELVVWPETVVAPGGPEPAHPAEMEALARELSVNMLYGARLYHEDSFYNSIVLLSYGKPEFETYHKQHLVPFVEYCPLAEMLNNLVDLGLQLGQYRPGKETSVFDVAGLPLAGVVCYESYFGNLTRRFAVQGARHLFVLTNDSWFGQTTALEQHAQVAALRAAEMGIGVTQVANSGLTVSYDYRGRERLRSAKQKAETHVIALDLAGRPTPYRLLGDYFPAFWNICLALYGTGCARRHYKQRHRKIFKRNGRGF